MGKEEEFLEGHAYSFKYTDNLSDVERPTRSNGGEE